MTPEQRTADLTARQAMATRQAQLRRQLTEGEAALAELDAQRERLVATLLRLSGAVQVLGELLDASVPASAPES